MNARPIDEPSDPDLRGAMAALKRAAQRARDIAIQTGTGIVVSENGVLRHISAQELIRERELEQDRKKAE